MLCWRVRGMVAKLAGRDQFFLVRVSKDPQCAFALCRVRSLEAGLAAIELHGVVKRFGPITAVDGLTLEVPAGVCLGLLGPNGAGKSTTMRMLTAQSRADEGEITVLGHPVPAESKEARALMGVVPQTDNLDEELTVRQNLEVFAHLYRVPRAGHRRAVDRALEI